VEGDNNNKNFVAIDEHYNKVLVTNAKWMQPPKIKFIKIKLKEDRLCGLVVRVLDYRCRGPGFDSRALQKKVVGLERGPLSLVST
jgi:hypothetical protein